MDHIDEHDCVDSSFVTIAVTYLRITESLTIRAFCSALVHDSRKAFDDIEYKY